MRGNVRSDATVIGTPRVELFSGTIEHKESKTSRKIGKASCTVGRSDCDLRLDDREVSALHCELVATEEGVRLRDLGSRNGTFIEGVRVVEVFLTKPTRIRVGKTSLEFIPSAPTSQPLPRRFGRLESESPRMQAVFGQLARLAPTSTNLHLTGESGVGKGYFARLIHEESKRASKPFVTIDLAAIAPTLIESALFGHEKGAFTGATHTAISPFVEADGGTVFLDEIGDLPLELQKRLLRAIDERVVQPVGGSRAKKVDVRIVSATLHRLQEKVNRKEFRDDLFYRLGPRIELPPLRERREDIAILTRQILADRGRVDLFESIPASTLDWMEHRAWEGNLRGLRDLLQVALDLLDSDEGPLDVMGAYHASRSSDSEGSGGHAPRHDDVVTLLSTEGTTAAAVRAAAQRALLKKLHADCRGVVSEIARRADLSRMTVRKELAEMGIVTPEARRKGGRGASHDD
jgi:DNA-binding NtrC family response regulator